MYRTLQTHVVLFGAWRAAAALAAANLAIGGLGRVFVLQPVPDQGVPGVSLVFSSTAGCSILASERTAPGSLSNCSSGSVTILRKASYITEIFNVSV